MNENALVPLADTMQLGKVLAESGFFSDARGAAQAVVKVLAGRELGFGPIASMVNIHIVEGKPTIGAHILASLIKRSPNHDFDLLKSSPRECELRFWRRDLYH